MRAKREERRMARSLRLAGWSVRRIAVQLDVSIASVSVWVRDIKPADPSSPIVPKPLIAPDGPEQTRTCGRCGRERPLSSFSRHPTQGLQHWCKHCFRDYFKERGDLHRKQSGNAKRRRRGAARAWVDQFLSTARCTDCAVEDALILEFDHVRAKQASVSELVGNGWSIARIKREISSCDVVCVNCHRRRTASRAASWRLDPACLETSGRLTRGERRNMIYIRSFLSASCCVDCGTRDLLVLEFDHRGKKRANVVDLARSGCRLQTLVDEIERCEVRCANCHRRRTRLEIRAARAA